MYDYDSSIVCRAVDAIGPVYYERPDSHRWGDAHAGTYAGGGNHRSRGCPGIGLATGGAQGSRLSDTDMRGVLGNPDKR